jgi:uncharacterized protein involved in response to NO
MAGAAGTMTLAVMTRATLGQTGQPLAASWPTQAIYAACVVAAVARICAAIETSHSDVLMHLAAGSWAAAFLGFGVVFGPALLQRSKRTRAG